MCLGASPTGCAHRLAPSRVLRPETAIHRGSRTSWRRSSQRAFIGTIIEYPVASILLQTEETLTLAVGSRLTLYEQNDLWGDFAAAAVLSGLPITVVFLVAQRWLVSGLTAGAVKG